MTKPYDGREREKDASNSPEKKKKPKAMCIMADNTVTQIGKLCSMKSSFSSISCFKHRVLNLDLCVDFIKFLNPLELCVNSM